jgi:creatinine amidohydrolase
MRLELLTWADIEAYLKTKDVILVPIGSTEQHGPNGLLGTDHLAAEAIAREAGTRAGTIVSPTIPFGMSHHHMGFPGTISLSPETLLALMKDIVSSLYRHGFRRFYFVNGHGGNTPTLGASFSSILEGCPRASFKIASWWLLPEITELAGPLFGGREGHHATPSEVSLTAHLHPDRVRFPSAVQPVATCACLRAVPRNIPDGRCLRLFLARPERASTQLPTPSPRTWPPSRSCRTGACCFTDSPTIHSSCKEGQVR